MRAQAKQVRHEEEEESAFVSMTDMTVGFLFIMMILLAFFASQMRDPGSVSKTEFDAVVAQRDSFEQERDAFEQESIAWRRIADTRANRIAELEALLAQLSRERDALAGEVQRLEIQRDELEVSLRSSEQEIERLQKLISELEAEITDRDARIEELQRQLAELQKVDPLEAYLAQVAQVRKQVLVRLRDAIRADFPDLQVELSEESDALRFQGEGLFASGRSNLASDKADIVSRLALRLDEVLPCFTRGKHRNLTAPAIPASS